MPPRSTCRACIWPPTTTSTASPSPRATPVSGIPFTVLPTAPTYLETPRARSVIWTVTPGSNRAKSGLTESLAALEGIERGPAGNTACRGVCARENPAGGSDHCGPGDRIHRRRQTPDAPAVLCKAPGDRDPLGDPDEEASAKTSCCRKTPRSSKLRDFPLEKLRASSLKRLCRPARRRTLQRLTARISCKN